MLETGGFRVLISYRERLRLRETGVFWKCVVECTVLEQSIRGTEYTVCHMNVLTYTECTAYGLLWKIKCVVERTVLEQSIRGTEYTVCHMNVLTYTECTAYGLLWKIKCVVECTVLEQSIRGTEYTVHIWLCVDIYTECTAYGLLWKIKAVLRVCKSWVNQEGRQCQIKKRKKKNIFLFKNK